MSLFLFKNVSKKNPLGMPNCVSCETYFPCLSCDFHHYFCNDCIEEYLECEDEVLDQALWLYDFLQKKKV